MGKTFFHTSSEIFIYISRMTFWLRCKLSKSAQMKTNHSIVNCSNQVSSIYIVNPIKLWARRGCDEENFLINLMWTSKAMQIDLSVRSVHWVAEIDKHEGLSFILCGPHMEIHERDHSSRLIREIGSTRLSVRSRKKSEGREIAESISHHA